MFLSYHHGPGPVLSEVYSFSALLKVNKRREETLERIDERCQNGFIYDFNKVIKHFYIYNISLKCVCLQARDSIFMTSSLSYDWE